MTYQVRYNRSTVHIAGIAERTRTAATDRSVQTGVVSRYAVSACPALSRAGIQMAIRSDHEDLREALKAARGMTYMVKMCAKCESAAEAVLAEQGAE